MTVIDGNEVEETIINEIWAEEAGLYLLITQPNDNPKRRIFRIMRGGINPPLDETVAQLTVASHQKKRIATAMNCIVYRGEQMNEIVTLDALPKEV